MMGVFEQAATVAATFDGTNYLFAMDYTANTDGDPIGNDLVLTTVGVPEPSTYAFALLGFGLLASYHYFRCGGWR